MARRKKFKKPRHRMKTVFGKGGGGHDKPLNHGVVQDMSAPSPADKDMMRPTGLNVGGSRLIHPAPNPLNVLAYSARARSGIQDRAPTRFPGKAAGKFEVELREQTRHKLSQTPAVYKSVFQSDTRTVRLWWIPNSSEFILVETDTLIGYRKESIAYTSWTLAITMWQMSKVSWNEPEWFEDTT